MSTPKNLSHTFYAVSCRRNMRVGSERCFEGEHSLTESKTVTLHDGRVFEVEPSGTHAVYVTRVK